MKTIVQFCKDNKLYWMAVKYRHQFGYFPRKGFDIVRFETREILVSFEPITAGSDHCSWYVRIGHQNYKGPRYFKRISKKILSYIDVHAKSYYKIQVHNGFVDEERQIHPISGNIYDLTT